MAVTPTVSRQIPEVRRRSTQYRTRPVSNLPIAYGQAASLLLDGMISRAKQSPGAANDFIPPYLFLWRHCIELQLKETLEMVANHTSQWTTATGQAVDTTFFAKDIRESHSLLRLWQEINPLVETILQKPQHDWHLPVLPLATVASLIGQLHQIDPGGDGVRYDRRRDGNPTMLGVNRVDLEHTQYYLFGIAEFLLWADRKIGTTMGLYLSESASEAERSQVAEALADDPE
jgi:hypothetical protein